MQGTNSTNAFLVSTSESATTWSSSGNLKTKSFKLTVLYGAKPDGANWTKTETADGLTGGEAEMDAHTEEELIYFTSLDESKGLLCSQREPRTADAWHFCTRCGTAVSVQAEACTSEAGCR